jgi:hypothetical protein
MPADRPRIILEKSSTVRRRYQRSNKRFKFTAEELKRIEREEEKEKRAKELREKDKKRIANKKKKAEADAKAREEARRQGLPDPNAGKIPASQPLLSKFLFSAKKPSPSEEPEPDSAKESTPEPSPLLSPETPHEPTPEPSSEPPLEPPNEHAPDPLIAEPVINEPEPSNDNGITELDSQFGDTEPDSDCFDDLEEEPEPELPVLESAATSRDPDFQNPGLDVSKDILDTDEFSDCSAFYDEDILNEAEAAATTQASHRETQSPPLNSALLQTPPSKRSKNTANSIASLGSSFRDDTADYLEDIFTRGCGDSFGELMQLGSKPR